MKESKQYSHSDVHLRSECVHRDDPDYLQGHIWCVRKKEKLGQGSRIEPYLVAGKSCYREGMRGYEDV